MASSLDDEVRAAAMAQVRRLRDIYGGRIPRSELMEGISLDGQTNISHQSSLLPTAVQR